MDKKFAESAQKAVTQELRTGLWRAYGRYEVHENKRGERGGMDFYAKRAHVGLGESDSRMWQYEPLVEIPDLFVRFARLADREITRAIWEEWIATYGLLGLQRGVNTVKG